MALYKEKKSKYWQIRFQHNGKQIARSSRTTRKADAARMEHKLRETIFLEDNLESAETTTIGHAITMYAETLSNDSNIQSCARAHIKFIETHLGVKRNLETLCTKDVERLKLIRARRGNKNATIKKMISYIRGFHKHARRLGYKTQTIEYPQIKVDASKLRYLSLKEERALLKELKPYHKDSWAWQQDNYDLVVMLLDTGARHSEITRLTWDDIDMNDRSIKLYRPKVKNESIIYMTDRVYKLLLNRHKWAENQYLFNDTMGGPRKYTVGGIKKAINRAGLKDVTIHTLRHTFASRMAQNGMSLQELQVLLGHTDISMTLRYSHLIQSDVSKKSVDIINSLNEEVKPKLKSVK